MSENDKSLFSTLEAACAILAGMGLDGSWTKGVAFALAFFFAMCAIRQLLLAYKDGSIVERVDARKGVAG